jgi:hypothetical protein
LYGRKKSDGYGMRKGREHGVHGSQMRRGVKIHGDVYALT